MARGARILSLAVVLALPPVASARALGSIGSSDRPATEAAVPAAVSDASARGDTGGAGDLHVIAAARGGGFGAYGGGGMRAAPRFGAGRFGHPGFRRFPYPGFPFRAHRFRPFVSFGFALPLYFPYYPYYPYAPYYPYNPYCDPASAYFYPPWCRY